MNTTEITINSLVKAGLANLADATRWAKPLSDACSHFGIDSPERRAAFLAQCAHESARFSVTVENLNYSAAGLARVWRDRFAQVDAFTGRVVKDKMGNPVPNALANSLARKPEAIANNVYANRMGNGDANSGDGWRFRGRGLLQLTGRNNYAAYEAAIGGFASILENPDQVALPAHAALSAAWYWHARNLNRLADKRDILGMTRLINGGTNGLEDRQKLYASALATLTA